MDFTKVREQKKIINLDELFFEFSSLFVCYVYVCLYLLGYFLLIKLCL